MVSAGVAVCEFASAYGRGHWNGVNTVFWGHYRSCSHVRPTTSQIESRRHQYVLPERANSKFDGLPREEIVRPVEPDRGHKQLLNVAIRACRREWGWNGVEIAKIDQILIDVLHSFWILQARFAPRSFYFAVLEIDGTDIFIVVECGVDCFNTPCNEIN